MIVNPIQTRTVHAGECTVEEFLDESLHEFAPGSVLAVTSKVVSLCENNVAPQDADWDELVVSQAQRYLASRPAGEAFSFTITQNILTPNSGVDESNVSEGYVLWPADPQASANRIRAYLVQRFGHQNIGVVITDSTCLPLRWGMFGMCLAHSGFDALYDYVGKQDLFGRLFEATQADIATGLAAAGVLVMGEGAESKPMAVLSDLPFVHFTGRDPSAEELAALLIEPEEDLFAPFFNAVAWKQGGQSEAPAAPMGTCSGAAGNPGRR